MRYVAIGIVALVVGGLIARAIWLKDDEPTDPLHVIVTQLKTHAIVEHERQVVVWYRACPDVLGVDPQVFVAWPAKLSYELELADVAVERKGDVIEVRTRAIRADEPAVPTDFMDYLSTNPLFNFVNEQQLITDEISKASSLARYLTAYFLLRDASLRQDFADEIESLVARLAAALGQGAVTIDVKIEEEKVQLPKLPAIELCAGSAASVNGQPFARMEDEYIVPIRFEPPSRGGDKAIKGIASVYGAPGKR